MTTTVAILVDTGRNILERIIVQERKNNGSLLFRKAEYVEEALGLL